MNICGTIKQNESKVDNDMLFVSEVLFHLNIMSMSGTCHKYRTDASIVPPFE